MVSHQLGPHYGAMAFYTATLHNLFLLYHVEMFVTVFRIDKISFWVGETIFLIWNSCNDPLFGWISDRKILVGNKGTNNYEIIINRLSALAWNGPLFALSFLAFWVAWIFPSLQFTICLCVYDGFLTMIDLHHKALLADLSISAPVRANLNMYCSLFSALGSISVFLSYSIWSHDSLVPFQAFCIFLASMSFVGFIYSSRCLKERCRLLQTKTSCESDESSSEILNVNEQKALKSFLYELSGHKNFIWFTAMNLIQVFHCHFNSNFFPLFLEILIGDDVSPVFCSILLGVSFVAPHINNLYFLSLCQRFGAYSVIRLLFWIKLILGSIMLLVKTDHLWVVCLFIASNRVFTEGTCKLLNLVISDIVDEDVVLHKRSQAVSALIFGTVAFLSKPGQTLAPLIGTLLLTLNTGHDVFDSASETGSIKFNSATMTKDDRAIYQLGVFHLLVYMPIFCAVLQLFFWSKFKLHGKRLDFVKRLRNGLQYSLV